ncbi:hypothetical protein A3C94_01280 [Candidatus Kaiserbacteria bacterium RIFCSPHIGHO2_02_FULL_55_17]|uniref:Uncharacterized protein n=1 Tax=Candidatus Kaiserbacteria bacterium RIFCSPHIGHO2_02_FULL_55_17 TaxID=1798496 RepID=A0A1F6DU53_9BACT|nr:MAG: hypothetical protein A3C94_01280 [Candidatus Kaiserbacteria bacterium RIFCSPHIGHO2_02_FULL_55_17]
MSNNLVPVHSTLKCNTPSRTQLRRRRESSLNIKAHPRLCAKCGKDAPLSQGVIIFAAPDETPLFWHVKNPVDGQPCFDEKERCLLFKKF